MRLAVRSNIDQVFGELDRYVDQVETVAVPRALNKLGQQAQTAGFRKVSEIYGIGPRTMEKYATLKFATAQSLEVELTVRGKGFPIYTFSPRQTRGGVSVLIKGRRFIIPHTFIARMPSGHVGVFARGAYGGKSTKRIVLTGEEFGRFAFARRRLPINELYTMSPPDAASNPDVTDAMDERVQEQAAKVLQQEINFATR